MNEPINYNRILSPNSYTLSLFSLNSLPFCGCVGQCMEVSRASTNEFDRQNCSRRKTFLWTASHTQLDALTECLCRRRDGCQHGKKLNEICALGINVWAELKKENELGILVRASVTRAFPLFPEDRSKIPVLFKEIPKASMASPILAEMFCEMDKHRITERGVDKI